MIRWTTGMDRMEAHFSKDQWPWRKSNPVVFREFCEWLGKTNTSAINAGMSPYRAGLGYVINCEKSKNDLEKLEAAWEEFNERKNQAAINRERQSRTTQATAESPPVIDLDDIKTQRIGTLKHMVATGREDDAREFVRENLDWNITWNEVEE